MASHHLFLGFSLQTCELALATCTARLLHSTTHSANTACTLFPLTAPTTPFCNKNFSSQINGWLSAHTTLNCNPHSGPYLHIPHRPNHGDIPSAANTPATTKPHCKPCMLCRCCEPANPLLSTMYIADTPACPHSGPKRPPQWVADNMPKLRGCERVSIFQACNLLN